jgi:hypothetical protein
MNKKNSKNIEICCLKLIILSAHSAQEYFVISISNRIRVCYFFSFMYIVVYSILKNISRWRHKNPILRVCSIASNSLTFVLARNMRILRVKI